MIIDSQVIVTFKFSQFQYQWKSSKKENHMKIVSLHEDGCEDYNERIKCAPELPFLHLKTNHFSFKVQHILSL
jgi:hypothetical protein